MCGIIGLVGKRPCVDFLLDGLEQLEYRGYDSAGVAVAQDGQLVVKKEVGRIAGLRSLVEQQKPTGTTGIGHTRWATHGRPCEKNSHPHLDASGRIAVVHNGIIENYAQLRHQLEEQGVAFASETDTEVVAQLLGAYYDTDLLTALRRVLPMLEGSFALGILDARTPDTLYCARRRSPLLVGKGEGECYLASDVSALIAHTRQICSLEDGDIAALQSDGLHIWAEDGQLVERPAMEISWDAAAAQKNGFDHFMLKEIFDQPQALQDTLEHYVDTKSWSVRRERMPFTPQQAMQLQELTIAACGTACHAGMMGRAFLEKLAGIRTHTAVASEYRYGPVFPPQGEGTAAFIAVSQSGETADTLAALRRAKETGMRVIALSNVIGSTISREADTTLYTLAGPEIAVASTKAYSTQVLLLEILALDLAHLRGRISQQELKEHLLDLAKLPQQMQKILGRREQVLDFARRYRACHDVFFIGRLMDYTTSLEAALKLKEVSYLHSEAYAAGELKHGTIALIDEETLVVAVATQPEILEKTYSNMEEVRARGAYLLLIGAQPPRPLPRDWEFWPVDASPLNAPLLSTVYAQLLAYYTALQHGCDIDKPRNLAKSVTVE